MNRRNLLIGAGSGLALASAGVFASIHAMGSTGDYEAAMAQLRRPLASPPGAQDLIRYATLAPNGHNAQPWRFRAAPGHIDILPDFARRTPVVDPDDHHLFVSLGCAAENMALAARATGLSGEVEFLPAGGGVRVHLDRAPAAGSTMFGAIPRRQSTRSDFGAHRVSAADLRTLAGAATMPNVELALISDRKAMNGVRDLVLSGNDAQMADPAFVRELVGWLRFNPAQALARGDGLYGVASGNPPLPSWIGPSAFDLMVTAKSERARYARQLDTSSGIAVFVGAQADPAHWVAVGRACQRFALQATALGIKHAFINQPVEVPGLRPNLAALIGMAGHRPDIVMRFGYAANLPFSPRRRPQMI